MKNFICNKCDKEFQSDGKRTVCDSCLSYNLDKHFCPECGEGFREKSNWRKHIKDCWVVDDD